MLISSGYTLWDGQELPLYDKNDKPINRGGTFDGIRLAKENHLKMNKDIHIIYCHRPLPKK